ncbi:minor capsid protein [Bacillus atrophaeus]|uniref:DUF3168 domain-containing protein n=1 Tax=Bacillus atrophaeus (strain 1942) TaxID=720555 RepID=A0ABM5LYQ7_BACA1|nr:minor capsid protein [Bacillus atrophaeus]AMR62312.1 hypothetical protein A1D11_07785 [Bacillus subtilis subsp. globigii]ADP32898.1 hypothetical protein BATR1942_09825 [Bacillus atrophaeus 1942]AIK48312.1 hypothetical protein DJ95_1852 [Bacillus atrophaeus subsp. globigii]ASS71700.1 hypothetical protein BaGK_12395 [Bacillus atrophaeus]EIM12315.1 hypothetical protein UY9_03526 [Bacillus atrophaeus C89]
MSITDIVGFLKLKGFGNEIYPLAFPATSNDDAILVEIGDGIQPKGVLSDFVITITVRNIHPSKAEQVAMSLINTLHGVTNVLIGDAYIVQMIAQSIMPAYLGKDEENRYFYSVNLRVLV